MNFVVPIGNGVIDTALTSARQRLNWKRMRCRRQEYNVSVVVGDFVDRKLKEVLKVFECKFCIPYLLDQWHLKITTSMMIMANEEEDITRHDT